MVDLGFPLFYAFLYFSPLLFLSQFSFQNLQDWTLNGKIVDSFFSHLIFLSLFLFNKLQVQLRMVRSWIPTFLLPFSFERFLSNSSKNELRVGRCGGRGRAHDKFMLKSKHPLRIQSFHGSRGYSIYSFAQLSEHSTGEEELWMVDLGFPLFYTFLISFSFHSFLFKTCKTELWMVRSWIPSFLIPFSFRCFFSKTSNFNFGW